MNKTNCSASWQPYGAQTTTKNPNPRQNVPTSLPTGDTFEEPWGQNNVLNFNTLNKMSPLSPLSPQKNSHFCNVTNPPEGSIPSQNNTLDETFEERAAIIEYDGGVARTLAESLAQLCVLAQVRYTGNTTGE